MNQAHAQAQYQLSTRKGMLALKAGQANTHKAVPGESYRVLKRTPDAAQDKLASDVLAKRHGDDLQLDYADGTQLTLQDYFIVCRSDAACPVTLAGDAPEGWLLGADAAQGAVLGDGANLLYAHGSPEALAAMAAANPGLAQPLAGLQGNVVTYLPQTSISALGWIAGGLGLAGLAAAGGGGGGGGHHDNGGGNDNGNNNGNGGDNGNGSNPADTTPPVFTSGATAKAIDENSGAGRVVYTATATDASAVTYSLGGVDAARFSIDPATGQVKLIANPDFETQSGYSFTVIATDAAGNHAEQVVTLSINDLDEDVPVFTSGATAKAIDENSGAGQVVYTATATDASAVTYSLGGVDAARFSIDSATGQVKLIANPDFETQSGYSFTVIATDAAGNHAEQAVTLNINDLDEDAPVFTSGTTAKAIDENSGAGQVVYTATATDASAVTYSLGGVDAARFSIDSATGQVKLIANPDFEAKSGYSFTVIAIDAAGNRSAQTVALAINDVDESTGGNPDPNPDPGPGPGPTHNNVQLHFVGGPAVAGNDLGVEVYRADGQTLIGTGTLDANGSVTVNAGDYLGVVVVKLVNAGAAADYLDEATGQSKDLSAQLYSMGVITVPGSTLSLNVNVLTTLAYAKAQEAAGGTMDSPQPLSVQQITQAAQAISAVFQVGDVLHTAVTPTNGGSYNPGDGLSAGEKYGAVLAAISGAEHADSKTVQQVLNEILQGITIDQDGTAHITKAVQDQLIAGGSGIIPTDPSGGVSGIVDTYAPEFTDGSSATAQAIAGNSGAGQLIYTAQATDSSGVTYSLSGADASAFTIDAETGAVTLTGNPDHAVKNSYQFTVVATDGAGNHSEQTVTLGINDPDATAPAVTLTPKTPADPTQNLGEGDGLTAQTHVITLADGSFVAAWLLNPNQPGAVIAVQHLGADGQPIGSVRQESVGGRSTNFSLAAVGDGYALSWVSGDYIGMQSVKLKLFDQNDTLQNVNKTDLQLYLWPTPARDAPAITVLQDGNYGVTWKTATGQLYHRDFSSADGTPIGVANIDLGTGRAPGSSNETLNTSAYDTIALGSDRQVFISARTDGGLELATYTNAGVFIGSVSFASGGASNPHIASLGSTGGVIVSWVQDEALYTQQYHPAMGLLGLANAVFTGPGIPSDSQLTALPDGGYLITFTSTFGDTSTILAARFDSGGNRIGNFEVLETASATNINTNAQVTLLGNGGYVIVWQGTDPEGDSSIYLQRFNATGQRQGNTEILEAPGNVLGADHIPRITAQGSDGAFLVVWQGDTGLGGTAIYTRYSSDSGTGAVIYSPSESATVQSTETGTVYLVHDSVTVTNVASITNAADSKWNKAAITAADTDTALALTGLQDGSYHAYAVDAAGNLSQVSAKAITIDAPPVFTSGATATAIDENSGAAQVVYMAAATDSGAISYSLGGADAALFSIDAATGAVTLTANPDYETKGSYSFTVIATDPAGHHSEQAVTLAVNDLEDETAPTITSADTAADIAENSGAGQVVYTVVATDNVADGITYHLKTGGDAAAFTIDADTGEVTLTADPDYETKSSYSFTVVARDAAGNEAEQAVTLTITDVDDTAPTVNLVPQPSMVQLEALNNTQGGDQYPQITALGSDGRFAVTWQGYDSDSSNDQSIFVQRFKADGSLDGDMVQLEALGKTDGSDQSPQIMALGSDGRFAVTWQGEDGEGDYSIFVQSFNADGSLNGDTVQLEALNKINGLDERPQITALGSDGHFAVTWSGQDSAAGDYSIFVQRFKADGSPDGAMVQLEALDSANGSDGNPQIAVLGSDGRFAVAWNGRDSAGDDSIFVQRFQADGSLDGGMVQLEALNRNNGGDYSPQITALGSDGAFVVTWNGQDSEGDQSIFVQRFNADGSLNGATVQLEALGKTNGNDFNRQITALGSDGRFAVTWYGQDSDSPTDYSIFVQSFNADGSLNGATVQLEALGKTDGTDLYPQITALGSDGRFVVTWQGQDSEGDWSIFVQCFKADGSLAGATVQLEAPGNINGADANPQITALGNAGAFAVTWQGMEIEGDSSIFVQRFNADGTPYEAPNAYTSSGSAMVQSTEMGTVYLVHDSVTVTNVASITNAADSKWNSVAITAANTNTALSLAGLAEGSYHAYAVDAAGNLSPISGNALVVDESAPVFTSGAAANVDENIAVTEVVYRAEATDSIAVIYSLDGDDKDAFAIDVKTGEVRFKVSPDHETKASYQFTVIATDALGNHSEQPVTLTINDLDETLPTITSAATAADIAENSGAGQVVYTVAATDNVADGITYHLKTGGDAAAFTIDETTGAVTLTADPDYETKSSYSFTVIARDAAGNEAEQAVTLTITDVDDRAPTLTVNIPADEAASVAIGADIVLTFSEVVQAGSGSIRIVNDDDASQSLAIDVTDSTQVSISSNQVTINPTTDLLAGGHYHVEIDSGALQDMAGNAYEGISTATELNFTTAQASTPLTTGTLLVYSDGVYLDNNGDGVQDAGDTRLAATADGPVTVNGLSDGQGQTVSLDGGVWTLKLFSVLGPQLDMTGFGADDFVVVDMKTRTTHNGTKAMDLELSIDDTWWSGSAANHSAGVMSVTEQVGISIDVGTGGMISYSATGVNAPNGSIALATHLPNLADNHISFILPEMV